VAKKPAVQKQETEANEPIVPKPEFPPKASTVMKRPPKLPANQKSISSFFK
jgi:hypothetical protein